MHIVYGRKIDKTHMGRLTQELTVVAQHHGHSDSFGCIAASANTLQASFLGWHVSSAGKRRQSLYTWVSSCAFKDQVPVVTRFVRCCSQVTCLMGTPRHASRTTSVGHLGSFFVLPPYFVSSFDPAMLWRWAVRHDTGHVVRRSTGQGFLNEQSSLGDCTKRAAQRISKAWGIAFQSRIPTSVMWVCLNIGYSKIRWRIIVFSQPNFPREGRSHFGHSHVKHRSDKMLATTCPSIGWPAPWESCHHCMFVQRWGI